MKKWNAVILAGDRGPSDPVANVAKVSGKALVKLNRVTLIERIVNVLNEVECIDQIFSIGPDKDCLVGCEEVTSMFKRYQVKYLEPEKGPSSSALMGVKASAYFPTIIVTSDLPLLDAKNIEDYCNRIAEKDADFVVSAVAYSSINTLLPELKKTRYRFSDHEVCFANVFAVLKPPGMKALEYWQAVEQSRKNPLEVIRKIDWWSVLLYKLGRLNLEQASKKLSHKLGAKLLIEKSVVPELAIDIDSLHDFHILTNYIKED